MRPRLLWISDEVPYLAGGGGNIRQYHLLRRIAEEVDVDLLLAGRPPDDELRTVLKRVVCVESPVLRAKWHRGGRLDPLHRRIYLLGAFLPGRAPTEVIFKEATTEALRRALPDVSDYDMVQVEHEHLAGLLPPGKADGWAITLHNLMSVRFRQRAATERKLRVRLLHDAEARRAKAWERRIVERYSVTIVMSEDDARALPGPSVVVPNGVDVDRFAPSALPPEPRLCFSASFNYEPNVDATYWLCEEVLPRVRQAVPGATLVLVGREPNSQVLKFSKAPGVETHFDVPDVLPHLRSCRVALVPLRQGSGTRLKALEAMAACRPLVGTTIGLEGLGLKDGYSAAFADNPEALAAAAARLLTDDVMAQAMAARARRIAEQRFGWDRLAGRYLDEVLGGRGAGHPRPAANPTGGP
jgi:glycosyltransferase involved in cell wall biosynthesis